MSKAARNKGARFEQYTCDELSKWFFGREDVLRRVPQSGAWEKGIGDVMVPPSLADQFEKWPFYVECRNREMWDLSDLFEHQRTMKLRSWNVKTWWVETIMKASTQNMIPLLIITKNYLDAYVAFDLNKMQEKFTMERALFDSPLVYFYSDNRDVQGGSTRYWGFLQVMTDFVTTWKKKEVGSGS